MAVVTRTGTRASSVARSTGLARWLTRKNRGWYVLAYVLLAILALWTIFPFYWQIATSLRADVDLYTPVVTLIPHAVTTDHYLKIFSPGSQFSTQFTNSVIVALGTTAIAIVLGSMAGYALTRLNYFGRAGLARVLVYAYLAPGTILFIPLFVMMGNLNLRDTLLGLTLSHLTFAVPFATWMLMGYFKALPRELEEAAMVDGATRFGAFLRILLPLVAPGLVATSIFAFIQAWNEFIMAYVLLHSPEKQTLTVWLASFTTNRGTAWGPLMAGATLTALPVVIFFVAIQRRIAFGLTAGAVRG